MNPSNPLKSILFITLPENFSISKEAMHIDTTIPLPVQLPVGTESTENFDITTLTEEMILAGILTVLAYDKSNPNLNYYRSIMTKAKPNIKTELSEAAILKARNEDFDIAEEIFDALRGLDPEDMAIVLNTALFFDQRADSYRKSGLFEDADAYDSDAEYYYKQVMDSDNPLPDAYFNAGFFYLKKKDFARGKECFEIYLAYVVDMKDEDLGENGIYKKQRAAEIVRDISNRNLDDELFKSAYQLVSSGEEEKGLEKIREFLEKNPTIWNAWFLLGWALRRIGRYEDAEKAFEETIKLGGDNCDTLNELAICKMELGDLAGSKKTLLDAFQLEPENTKIMSNLGFVALKEGDIASARGYFTAVLEFDPEDKIAQMTLAQLEG